ncbi:Cyanophycin synthetase incomplete domain containing protein [Pandoravirus salinus]|uniref:Cyanophycin synthetase incomplete domain containing protein n=1 Tax=Pandoravirus salinus TaxID=1349410 RepID=A0A291ATG7_9VIRU|nr:Cyanophycin synthetase incomplete domain [Pandoravirus salinus]ATE82180.1 Cyanophycin synthetase incomplete domain containing protein [Pandoravirus salinus]
MRPRKKRARQRRTPSTERKGAPLVGNRGALKKYQEIKIEKKQKKKMRAVQRRTGAHMPGTVAAIVLVILVVIVGAALVLAASRQRVSRRCGTPPHLHLVLTEAQRRGRATADTVARANAARFPRARMTRAQHILAAAARRGWDITVWDAAGAIVSTTTQSGSPSGAAAAVRLDDNVDDDAAYRAPWRWSGGPDDGNTVRRILSHGGIVRLVPPPGQTSFGSLPPIVCRRDSISWTPRPDAMLAGDKRACSRWLAGHGVPVPPNAMVVMDVGAIRRRPSVSAATKDVAQMLGDRADLGRLVQGGHDDNIRPTIVIKPVEGTCGRGIVADLMGVYAVAGALARSCRLTGTSRWLIERQIAGPSHRTIIACPPLGAPPRIVYMCERLPPMVVGDGTRTVDELLAADAQARTLWHPPAPIADVEWMRRHGADPRHCVPEAGQLVRVRMATNWAQGGAHWRVDPDVCLHRDNAAMLCEAARCFPGRPFLVALDTVGDPSVAWWREDAVGPMVHDVELNSGLEDIPGGCDWVPADESRVFDAILQAYVA